MSLPTATEPRKHDEYTVGWMCALPKEQTAATAMLEEKHPYLHGPSEDPNTYTLGSIGGHNIVIACLPKAQIGKSPAATLATWMVSTFPSIKLAWTVGIGGGIPPEVRLGDVVVSVPIDPFPSVIQWDFSTVTEGSNFERTGALRYLPTSLHTVLTRLETEHALNGTKIPQHLEKLKEKWPLLASTYLSSSTLKDVLFKSDCDHVSESMAAEVFNRYNENEGRDEDDCRFCDKSMVLKRTPRNMKIHYGLIASSYQVITNATLRDRLVKSLGDHVLSVETEAAGLMNNLPCVVIRGICDYADSHKNTKWQEYAATVAAAFAAELLMCIQPSVVNAERPVKETLVQVSDIVSATEAHAEGLRPRLAEEDLKAIDWLPGIDYGPQQSDYLGRRQPGTGKWLLDAPEYHAWLNIEQKSIFCPGIPGAGKTILTSIVVEDLMKRFQADSNIGIAYVYCNVRRQREQTAESLLGSLLQQLTRSLGSLPESVRDLHDRHNAGQTQPSIDEICQVLHSVAALYSRLFVVIDALDEIQTLDGCRTRLLAELIYLRVKCRANIFSTSRFITEIVSQFEDSTLLEIRADRKDIETYLDGHHTLLQPFLRKDQELQREIKKTISEAAGGMFLLAQIYIGLLEDELVPNDIKKTLTSFQKLGQNTTNSERIQALDRAYKESMHKINRQKQGFKELAIRVLSWVTCAKRPLNKQELQQALATKVAKSILDEGDVPQMADIVSSCGGLITIDEKTNVVRLLHHTAQIYFEKTRKSWFPNAEAEIADICFAYLSFDTFKSGSCPTDVEFEKRLATNPFYSYAAHNWGHHARKVSPLPGGFIDFAADEGKVEAASQALMAYKNCYSTPEYSQQVPKKVVGLHLAAYFGVQEGIMVLHRHGHNLDQCDSHNRTPLSYAAEHERGTVARVLLKLGATVDIKDSDGYTPLTWAASYRDETIVRLLLKHGAAVNVRDNDGWTPLTSAASFGDEAIARVLLERGADVNIKDSNGLTPLWRAVLGQHEAVAQLLLEHGADINVKDGKALTPLGRAVAEKHEAMSRVLLERGAAIEAKDTNGLTPLWRAVLSQHEAIARLLLERGADANAEDSNGLTPLGRAVADQHEAITRLLLEHGANVDVIYNNGITPLWRAVTDQHEAIARLLLEHGADVDAKDEKGRTPLWRAVADQHVALARLLLERGGVVDEKDNQDQTLLRLVDEYKSKALERLFDSYQEREA